MFSKARKSVVLGLTSVIAVSTILSASADSTTKTLSSNFTLVNLVDGANTGDIRYVLENGNDWRTEEPDPGFEDTFTLTGLGAQLERRQYFDEKLPAGSGSVVVSTQGPVGAVVQIQARGQSATNGAYIGVSEGATEANLPLVMRRRDTASGLANSQIIVQNASGGAIAINIKFFDGVTGNEIPAAEIDLPSLAPNAAKEYDLDDDVPGLPEQWYGSAVVTSPTANGEVAVVTNLFSGNDAMQTYNAFTTFKRRWGIPLMASRLANGLSTPLVIQNKSGGAIPIDGITVSCKTDPNSPNQAANFERKNKVAIPNNSAFFDFNPVTATDPATGFPTDWYGACTVNTGDFDTALFVQMRVVGHEGAGNSRAGAYEGIPLDGTDKVVVIPLFARRLTNGFASNATILNLSQTNPANVELVYKGAAGLPAGCSATFSRTIPAGGALLQNHRVVDAVANSVPEIDENCSGTLTVTSSDQAIDGFVQLDQLDIPASAPAPGQVSGDRFMAHNVFNLP